MKETLIVAVIAVLGIYGLARALGTGVMNLGGGRAPDFFVSYAESPGIFVFGIVLMLVVVGLCLVYLWRRFTS